MFDAPPQPPPIAAETQAGVVPADIKAMLDAALAEGDNATIERMFGYARRARPDAAAAIDRMQESHKRQLAARQQERATAERERLSSAGPLMNWKGQIEFGASWTTGAASSFGLLGSLDLERKGLAWTNKLLLRGELQDTNGARAVERLTASWQPRYALSERAYLYGLGQYEHDPALGYDTRYSTALGAGLRIGRGEGFRLLLEGGPALRRTEDAGEDRTALAGRVSADLNWAVATNLTFQQRISAYYEEGQVNGVFASAFDTKLSSKLTLRLSYEYRYENEAPSRTSGSASRASLVLGL